MYYFIGYLVKMILRIFGKTRVYHKELIPANGPFVVACTHTGWVDVLYLGVVLLPLKIHYMAKKQLFENKFVAWFLKKLNAFPVDRDHPGPSVLKIPFSLLSEGEIIGIFPSGTRTTEQTSLKQGAVTIAQRSNVPIIPAAFNGPNNLKELFARKKASLIFGKPIYITSKDKEGRKYFLEVLEQKLIELEKELE